LSPQQTRCVVPLPEKLSYPGHQPIRPRACGAGIKERPCRAAGSHRGAASAGPGSGTRRGGRADRDRTSTAVMIRHGKVSVPGSASGGVVQSLDPFAAPLSSECQTATHKTGGVVPAVPSVLFDRGVSAAPASQLGYLCGKASVRTSDSLKGVFRKTAGSPRLPSLPVPDRPSDALSRESQSRKLGVSDLGLDSAFQVIVRPLFPRRRRRPPNPQFLGRPPAEKAGGLLRQDQRLPWRRARRQARTCGSERRRRLFFANPGRRRRRAGPDTTSHALAESFAGAGAITGPRRPVITGTEG
jgi:hypothetical protein